MSSLNTLGFNVRRKRNHNIHHPLASKPDKTSSTPTLAFTAPAPSSTSHIISKSHVSSPINKNNSKSKVNKQHLPKDPKQSTLLPFFGTPQAPTPSTPLPSTTLRPSYNYATITQSPSPLQTTTKSLTTSQEHQNDHEKNELCVIRRRPMTINDLLPILMETFGEHSDGIFLNRTQGPVLLQVKPNRTLHTDTLQLEAMEDDLTSTQQRRRRRSYDIIDDDNDLATETLRAAFTKSLSLAPVKKRLCGKFSTKSEQQHNGMITLIGTGDEQRQQLYALEDEFSNQGEENKILRVRRSLSPGQVNSLVLDIANELLAFDDNTWCATYIGRSLVE